MHVAQSKWADLAAGTASGIAATAAMSGAMLLAQRLGWLGRMPPQIITDHAIDAAGAIETPRPARRGAAALAHFGFGGAAGALFGALARPLAPRAAPGALVAGGAAFGSLVWLVSYAGWIPALGILPTPPRDRAGRPTAMLLSHLVYGATLGALWKPLSRRL